MVDPTNLHAHINRLKSVVTSCWLAAGQKFMYETDSIGRLPVDRTVNNIYQSLSTLLLTGLVSFGATHGVCPEIPTVGPWGAGRKEGESGSSGKELTVIDLGFPTVSAGVFLAKLWHQKLEQQASLKIARASLWLEAMIHYYSRLEKETWFVEHLHCKTFEAPPHLHQHFSQLPGLLVAAGDASVAAEKKGGCRCSSENKCISFRRKRSYQGFHHGLRSTFDRVHIQSLIMPDKAFIGEPMFSDSMYVVSLLCLSGPASGEPGIPKGDRRAENDSRLVEEGV